MPYNRGVFFITVFLWKKTDEKNIIGGFMGATNLATDIPDLIAMYQAGRLKLDELITGRYPLDRINEAVESTEKGEGFRNVIMFD